MQRRPKQETAAVTTLWTMLALHREGTPFNRETAAEFVAKVTEPESTEYLAVHGLVTAVLDPPKVPATLTKLLAAQNEDGGWGWKINQPSDALGTGYALYALKQMSMASDQVTAATNYLLQTQHQDGAWSVPGTKRSAGSKATETATDWGTAWAIIALASQADH